MRKTSRHGQGSSPVGAPVLAVLLASCAAASVPPATPAGAPAVAEAAADDKVVAEQPGTITKVGSFGYGIVPDKDPGTRYAPDKLAEEFQVDGLAVVFSGRLTDPPEGVRQWGTPLKLETIRKR